MEERREKKRGEGREEGKCAASAHTHTHTHTHTHRGACPNDYPDRVCRYNTSLEMHDPPLLFDLHTDPQELNQLDTDEYGEVVAIIDQVGGTKWFPWILKYFFPSIFSLPPFLSCSTFSSLPSSSFLTSSPSPSLPPSLPPHFIPLSLPPSLPPHFIALSLLPSLPPSSLHPPLPSSLPQLREEFLSELNWPTPQLLVGKDRTIQPCANSGCSPRPYCCRTSSQLSPDQSHAWL